MSFTIFLLGMALELVIVSVPFIWNLRRWIALPAAMLIGFWNGMIFFENKHFVLVFVVLIGVYRIFNLARLAIGRIPEQHLRVGFARTALVLGTFQGVMYLIANNVIIPSLVRSTGGMLLIYLAWLQLVAGVFILVITSRNIVKTRHKSNQHFYSDKDLPTVSVAIPARNETAELASCLRAVIANDYPKLEILVLDDCSQDRTPQIIKDFAQQGVRFLEGKQPPKRWLAKNYAYDQLAEASNGEYILFCGVDVRLGPGAIRALITTQLNKKRAMLSVLPLRIGGGVNTAFVQPMRYWWELALPRRRFNRPPVLSTLWVISRKKLEKLGGFDAVSRSILPEVYFARELIKSDNYAFIRADEDLDVRTIKSAKAQLSTAVRTRYPQLRRRPENVLFLAMIETTVLLLPFGLVLYGFLFEFETVHWIFLINSAILIISHYLILSSSNPANSIIALINFPFVVMTEIVLLHVSMYRYEFTSVQWKGRNVCVPLMQVTPRLSK